MASLLSHSLAEALPFNPKDFQGFAPDADGLPWRRLEQAHLYAQKLARLAPDQPGPREMLEQLERELRSRR